MATDTTGPEPSRFSIEVQHSAGAYWRDEGLRVLAVDHKAAEAAARREYPNAAGVWASLLRPPYIDGIGNRVIQG